MGKLNYLARRISGIKAGQAVSKDLKKRFPPGLGSKSAARDPILEIDVTGKALTDNGFALFVDDLIGCIKFKDDEHPMGLARVTEFHLQGNQLTIACLPKLGEVIALSAGDIRELDISNNEIRIRTPEDIKIWVAFLNSFEDCFVLKKLDLGNNPLGRMGVEHLARIYLKSDLNFLEDDAEALLGPCSSEESDDFVEGVADMKVTGKENEPVRPKKSPNKGKAAKSNSQSHIDPAELKKYACTRGLRSIPYFIVSSVGLTNTSAIHLLSMLNVQRTPDHLLNFLPPGKAPTLPESAPLCKSIIWRPCYELTAHTLRMLEVAEALREKDVDTESEANDASDNGELQEMITSSSAGSNKCPEVDEVTQKKLHDKLEIEYTRLCKRVRLEAIKKDGVHSCTLWSTALKMMVVSRTLLLDDKDRHTIEEDPEEGKNENQDGSRDQAGEQEQQSAGHHDPEDSSSEGPTFYHIEQAEPRYIRACRPVTNTNPMAFEYSPEFIARMALHISRAVEARRRQQAAPSGPFHPAAEAFHVNFPTLQEAHEAIMASRTGEGIREEVSDEDPAAEAPATSKKRDIQEPLERVWRFGLPTEVWRRVISDVVNADGILDRDQQVRIMEYAADWKAVEYEQTIKGAENHQQIWKLLETLKCFTYSYL
ncbi:leucine rich repeat protein [Aspergillus ellipticus CBS 707.79]|uniref:Leucine rich repeat protein n=1 Tax=Aspergillus ellipticus CBS 707.79 TaxID=1448320 RepID=A0A319DC57_9EURO|nr:leucine rich repeat protein [Aspergillus ellipticus CBS 707.79]